MRLLPVRLVSRIVAIAAPVAVAALLAACGNPVAPGDSQIHRAAIDSVSVARRAAQLQDSTTLVSDTTGRGPIQPWW